MAPAVVTNVATVWCGAPAWADRVASARRNLRDDRQRGEPRHNIRALLGVYKALGGGGRQPQGAVTDACPPRSPRPVAAGMTLLVGGNIR